MNVNIIKYKQRYMLIWSFTSMTHNIIAVIIFIFESLKVLATLVFL